MVLKLISLPLSKLQMVPIFGRLDGNIENNLIKGWFFNMKFYLVTINAKALISFYLSGNNKNNTSLKILKASASF